MGYKPKAGFDDDPCKSKKIHKVTLNSLSLWIRGKEGISSKRESVMAVYKRKLPNGDYTPSFYYDFKINGKRYKGCTHKSSKKEAMDFVEELKIQIRSLQKEGISANRRKKGLINFRESLTNEIQGNSIDIEDIWQRFRDEAPAKMKRIPGEKGWKEKEAYLNDFLSFLKEKHPACKSMRDVTAKIAQQYIGLIKTSGRFCKTINSNGITYQSRITKLSSSSVNEYITQLKQIFRILSESAGLLENPFASIEKASKKSKKRDVFEINELEKIDSYLKEARNKLAHSSKEYEKFLINEAVFIIGINTGLRRGDISLLKWRDVDFANKTINRELLKTNEEVSIPMPRRLYDFLKAKHEKQVNEYVIPDLAAMYQVNTDGISYRFKKMLKQLNIQSQKQHEERSRRTSCKDIHSLRHTFCYLHGMQGTPLIVLQSMVGHMDKKMTESYMMHQTEELKKEAIEKFSMKAFQPVSLDSVEEKKNQLIEMVKGLSSEEDVEGVLSFIKGDNLSREKRIGSGRKL